MYRPPEVQCIYCDCWMDLEEGWYSPCHCETDRRVAKKYPSDYELSVMEEEAA